VAYDVKLLNLAESDIDDICRYLSQFYPGTPSKFLDTLDESFNNVSFNPYMYPKYKYNKEYRKIVADDYLVFYKIDKDNNLVKVYRILHGMRNISTIIEKLKQLPEKM